MTDPGPGSERTGCTTCHGVKLVCCRCGGPACGGPEFPPKPESICDCEHVDYIPCPDCAASDEQGADPHDIGPRYCERCGGTRRGYDIAAGSVEEHCTCSSPSAHPPTDEDRAFVEDVRAHLEGLEPGVDTLLALVDRLVDALDGVKSLNVALVQENDRLRNEQKTWEINLFDAEAERDRLREARDLICQLNDEAWVVVMSRFTPGSPTWDALERVRRARAALGEVTDG